MVKFYSYNDRKPMTVTVLARLDSGIFKDNSTGRAGKTAMSHLPHGKATNCLQCGAPHPRVIIKIDRTTIRLCDLCRNALASQIRSETVDQELEHKQ